MATLGDLMRLKVAQQIHQNKAAMGQIGRGLLGEANGILDQVDSENRDVSEREETRLKALFEVMDYIASSNADRHEENHFMHVCREERPDPDPECGVFFLNKGGEIVCAGCDEILEIVWTYPNKRGS